MNRRAAILFAVIFAFSALAGEPPEPSITPAAGPTSGGTEVTIKGTFSTSPYWVYFGDVPAATTMRLDSTTLKATTPAHLPGTVAIRIFEYDLFLATDLTFTFTGDVPEQAYTRILLPLFVGDTPGAFGTVFRTDLWALAKRNPVQVFGVEVECVIVCVPTAGPAEIPTEESVYVTPNGTPARFAYVPKEQMKDLSMTLLAYERTSGELETLPVVRFDEAADTEIALPSVPLSPARRATLRIYAAQPATVTLRVGRVAVTEETIHLAPGRDMFDPAYAAWSNFPDVEPEVDVRLTSDVPVWAMVTLTNNSTNTITAIAPQP